jgi:hypothetical protein
MLPKAILDSSNITGDSVQQQGQQVAWGLLYMQRCSRAQLRQAQARAAAEAAAALQGDCGKGVPATLPRLAAALQWVRSLLRWRSSSKADIISTSSSSTSSTSRADVAAVDAGSPQDATMQAGQTAAPAAPAQDGTWHTPSSSSENAHSNGPLTDATIKTPTSSSSGSSSSQDIGDGCTLGRPQPSLPWAVWASVAPRVDAGQVLLAQGLAGCMEPEDCEWLGLPAKALLQYERQVGELWGDRAASLPVKQVDSLRVTF